jgi:hypothetical protein
MKEVRGSDLRPKSQHEEQHEKTIRAFETTNAVTATSERLTPTLPRGQKRSEYHIKNDAMRIKESGRSLMNLSREAKSRLIVCIAAFVMNMGFFFSEGNLHLLTFSNGNQESQEQVRSKRYKIQPIHHERDRRILYLHVGKTGGTSLDMILRSNCRWYKKSQNSCFEAQADAEESVLSRLTERTVHVKWDAIDRQYSKDNATSFLFTVRNPMSRVVSAFNMEHLKNYKGPGAKNPYLIHLKEIFQDCFPVIEDLAKVFAAKVQFNVTKSIQVQDFHNANVTNFVDCFDLGTKTLNGQGHLMQSSHLFYNYAFYASESIRANPEKEVLVIRTENLWRDVTELNMDLANTLVEYGAIYNDTVLHNRKQTASEFTFSNLTNHTVSHGSEAYAVSAGLTKKGREVLCCHLSVENQVFEDVVRAAVNINDAEKEEYLGKFYSECGVSNSEQKQYRKNATIGNEKGGANTVFSWEDWSNARGCNVTG